MATHDLQNLSNPNIRIVSLEQEIIFDGNIQEYISKRKIRRKYMKKYIFRTHQFFSRCSRNDN